MFTLTFGRLSFVIVNISDVNTEVSVFLSTMFKVPLLALIAEVIVSGVSTVTVPPESARVDARFNCVSFASVLPSATFNVPV